MVNKEQDKKALRVLLIQPPNIGGVSPLICHMNEKGESVGFKPPLGLLSIATLLKQRSPYQVMIMDALAEKLNFNQCLERIGTFHPDVIGISAWTDWWYSAYNLGLMIKKILPGAHLCYGGPHVSIYPGETLGLAHTDSIIVGDGEEPFLKLCDTLSVGKTINDCPGLHFKQNGLKEAHLMFSVQNDLDVLPIPDRTLLPIKNYTSVLSSSDYITTMMTSRGCPYNCIYCKLTFQKPVSRSAAGVIREFREIENLGIKEVEVYDDTFSLSKKRVLEICQGLIDQKIRISWAIRDRVNIIDEEMLTFLKRAGCKRIHYGIESGVDRVLALMNKHITTALASRAVRLAKEQGFAVLAYFMLGNKGESEDDIKTTIKFALSMDTDYAGFSIAVPYPGTALYLEALSRGIIKNDYWREFALSPSPNFRVPRVFEENLSLSKLVKLRNYAIRKYYTRPEYILKEIRKVKNLKELSKKSVMALRLFSSCLKGYQGH